jgi:tape measure domain-containing protein
MATTRFIDIKLRSKKAERGVDRLDRKMTGLGRTVDDTAKSLFSLSKVAIGVFSGIALNAVTKYADAFSSIQNQIRQTTKTTEDLTQRTAELLDVANRSRIEFAATAELYTQLNLSTENLNLSTGELLRLTETIGKSFAVSGKSAAESAGAIRQLGQAFSAGALRGDEFNSIAEGAPEIMRALQRSLELTQGELRDFAATGGITAEILVTALGEAAEVIDDKMSKAVKTFAQSTQEANNNMTAFIGSSAQVQNIVGGAGEALIIASDNIESIARFAGLAATVFAARLIPAILASTKATLKSESASTLDAKSKVVEAKAIKALTKEETISAAASVTKSRKDLIAKIATKEKAIETVKAARAAEAEAIATLDAAKASVIHARATAKLSTGAQVLAFEINNRTIATKAATAATATLTKAELAASASAAKLSATKAASTGVISASAAAKTASAAAATRLSAANVGMALSARIAATATTTLASAMALVGGPLGAALLAATAIFLFVDAAESADEKSKRLAGSVDDLKNSFLGLTEAQRVTEVSRINNEFKSLSAQLVIANDRLNSVRDTVQFKGKAAIVIGLEDDLQDINDQLDLLAIKRQAIFEGGLPSISGETREEAPSAGGLGDKEQKKLDAAVAFFDQERRLTERHLRNLFDLENEITTEAIVNEENRFLDKAARLQARHTTELEALGTNDAAKKELTDAFNEAEKAALAEHETLLTGIKTGEDKKRTDSETNAARTRLKLGGKAISDFAGLSKKGQKIQRRLQQADIIASTAVAVVDSFRNAGGFPLGIPAAAAMAAAGAVQLKQLGGQGGGGSIASPTGAAGGAQPSPTATAQDLPQQTRAIDIRIDDNALLTGAMFKEALNSVLESDSDIAINISNAQAEAVRTGAI